MEIHLSIYGSGRIIKYFNMESSLWKLLGHLNTEKIRSVLYSNEFLNLKLKLPNGIEASTFFEIVPDKQSIAYDADRITRLEIKIKHKNRKKIFLKDIISEEFLFPLYNYSFKELVPFFDTGLIIVENDIGNLGKCKLTEDNFEADKLSFDLINIRTLMSPAVLKIHYGSTELQFDNGNSLFNGNVFIIKTSQD